MKAFSAAILSALIALSLLGCGGGGGGDGGSRGGSSTITPGNSLALSPAALNVSADAGVSQSPAGTINLSVTTLPEGGLYVGHNFTGGAITDIAFAQTSQTAATLTVYFDDPVVIGPGEYNGTIAVSVCEDQQCARPLVGSPKTVQVRYTVTGVQPPKPELSVSQSALSSEAFMLSSVNPTATLDFTLRNASTSLVSVNADHTNSAVLSVYKSNTTPTGGTFTVSFKAPSQLAPGVYTDVITLTATCNCPRGIEGAPLSIPVRYTISDTVAGPEGFSVRFLQLAANDLTWSATHQKIYAAVPSSASQHGNSVAEIDPVTGTVDRSSFVGSEPGVLSISDDGQYLYAALGGANSVRRKRLPNLENDILIQLDNHPTYGGVFANDVQVAPGLPHTIAVARRASSNFSGTAAGVVIFDDAVARSTTAGDSGSVVNVNWVQWSTATRLYGNTSQNTSFAVAHMDVNASGVSIVASQMNVGNAFNFGRLHFAGGLLYSDGGEAYDPVSMSVTGRFLPSQFEWSRGVIPDLDHNKLFMISTDSGSIRLRSFNLTTFTPIASVPISLSVTPNIPVRLIRWGADGLAFATENGRIVIIKGPFVSQVAE